MAQLMGLAVGQCERLGESVAVLGGNAHINVAGPRELVQRPVVSSSQRAWQTPACGTSDGSGRKAEHVR